MAGPEEAVVAHPVDLELGRAVALADLVGVGVAVVEVGDAGLAHQRVVGERQHRHRGRHLGEPLGCVGYVDAEVVLVHAPAAPLPHHAGRHVVEDAEPPAGVVPRDARRDRRDAAPEQRRPPADRRRVEPPVAGAGGDVDDPVQPRVVDERDRLAAEAVADPADGKAARPLGFLEHVVEGVGHVAEPPEHVGVLRLHRRDALGAAEVEGQRAVPVRGEPGRERRVVRRGRGHGGREQDGADGVRRSARTRSRRARGRRRR